MAVVANPLVLRIFINSTLTRRSSGWAERWPLLETNWNLALPKALQMVQARQNVLSSNAYIQWACLGTVAPPYYEQTLVTDQLNSLPQWGPAAIDMQGVLFNLNTDAGENAQRLFRAVEATEFVHGRWIYSSMLIPFAPPALPADLTTAPKDLLWQNTLATFRQYAATQQPMSDGHHGEGEGYWVDPYSQITYIKISMRRWGPAWRRMSWEAGNWNHAPWFSPCGCVVTVNRISYAIPCRFGVGWRLRTIHYYPAKPGARVMTFRTPFCCWDRSKEYTYFEGVGEARKYKAADWTTGKEYGNAPGTMWTGSQRDFEGYAPLPSWNDTTTPIGVRPRCDFPQFSRPVGPGGLCMGGNGSQPFVPA